MLAGVVESIQHLAVQSIEPSCECSWCLVGDERIVVPILGEYTSADDSNSASYGGGVRESGVFVVTLTVVESGRFAHLDVDWICDVCSIGDVRQRGVGKPTRDDSMALTGIGVKNG